MMIMLAASAAILARSGWTVVAVSILQFLLPFPSPSFVVASCHPSLGPPPNMNRLPLGVAMSMRGGARNTFDDDDDDRSLVLIIDVDNTLYNEEALVLRTKNGTCAGIERQIVENTHAYCHKHFQMSPQQADDLFRSHGSTIEGLRSRMSPAQMKDYYEQVYTPIDVSGLLHCTIKKEGSSSYQDTVTTTGYTHSDNDFHSDTALPKMISCSELRSWFETNGSPSLPCPVYLASNSPSWHVRKVLCALGLSRVPWTGLLTPDLIQSDNDDEDQTTMEYPTKVHPNIFYQKVIAEHPIRTHRIVLLDDSSRNVHAARSVGIDAIRVCHRGDGDDKDDGRTLQHALNLAFRHIDRNYTFSDVRYLAAKNKVDAESIHASTWNDMIEHVVNEQRLRRHNTTKNTLCIVDLGAGALSMLELLLKGTSDKRPLVAEVLLNSDTGGEQATGDTIVYHAYEPNIGLLAACRETMLRLGFVPQDKNHDDALVFAHVTNPVTVHLHMYDFATIASGAHYDEPPPRPHLIVGSCFADLMDPYRLVQDLLAFIARTSKSSDQATDDNTLVYFPITFSGTTQFWPPEPFGEEKNDSSAGTRRRLPSDTVAFRLYSNALSKKHGHNLDPLALITAFEGHGARLLRKGPSNWWIDPNKNGYLWETMLYFFGTTAGLEILKSQWDSTDWIRRARRNRPKIHVTNVDLLFKLRGDTAVREEAQYLSAVPERTGERLGGARSIQEIQFTSPYKVTTIHTSYKRSRDLEPNDVEVTSVASLISSGTELKIFKGLFDDAALDLNIEGMAEERMAYPLAYGYSLVGRVTRCGSDVTDAERLLGRLVFCFSPHASHALVDRGAIQVVPEGIDPEDATFMPSVETALSLVHDAHVRAGEKVAVFGQGLIGLLVTAILRLQPSFADHIAPITAFDTIPDRLAAAADMGASQAILPSSASRSGPFDVTVEISGSAQALQSAIDNTRSGGRTIVGSWYGNGKVNLKLGIDFHRSHKMIRTSQVSEIPAELRGIWTKNRRFALTWELVKRIQPSRLVTRRASLDEAQSVYEALDCGKEIAALFLYNQF